MINFPFKKSIQYQKLDRVSTYSVDTSDKSDSIFVISDFPSELTSGKNSFKICANGSSLKCNSDILIEILDANNNTIYREINDYKDRLGRRIVTIFVYPDSIIGDAKIIILGVLKSELVPKEWENIFNVKWEKIVHVDPLKKNISEIIFDEYPSISIQEQFKPAVSLEYLSGSFITINSSSFNSPLIYSFLPSSIQNAQNYNQFIQLFTGNQNQQNNSSQSSQINLNSNCFSLNNAIQALDNRINATFGYYLSDKSGPTIKTISGTGFSDEMLYGEFSTGSFTSSICDIVNNNTIRVANPFSSSSSNNITLEEFNITYKAQPSFSGSQAYKTFSTIQFHNLNPISGDIYRIKTYAKNKSLLSEYELIGNNVVTPTNMLIDTGSVTMNLDIGYFKNQSIIDSYWVSDESITKNDTYLINSISGSGTITTNAIECPFYINNQYQLYFNCFASKNNSARIKIFMSGSAFNNSDSSGLGLLIGEINFSDVNTKLLQDLKLFFEPSKTGFGKPVFKIIDGDWHLSNIKIFPLNENGFTPNYFSTNLPVNSLWDNNVLDFKFEFFNYSEEISEQIIFLENVLFINGSPFYVQGNYNIVTGSQFIGNKLGTGLKLAGDAGGYFTSIGYDGFNEAYENSGDPGFLIWSGSALPSSSNNYTGVGIEAIANSESFFRFRTDPSEFEVRTKKFFLGGTEQYISGSNGAIEISSSNFYLDNQGNLTATSARLKNYVFSDFIANRIIEINDENKASYIKEYLHPIVNKNFNYLDLSGESEDSAMFIRFSGSLIDYPITHIRAPSITETTDSQVGGAITLEFIEKSSSDTIYFYDLRKDVGEDSIEFENEYQLSGSNSIHNLSGSFSYRGFLTSCTGSDETQYTGSLAARQDARYVFIKGLTGWGLTSTTNFDRTGLSLMDLNISFLKGVRRSIFIHPNEMSYVNETGSYSLTYDTNFNMPEAQLTLGLANGSYGYGDIYISYLVPDYIRTNYFRVLLYFRIDPTIAPTGENYTVNFNFTGKITDVHVSDSVDNDLAPIINPVSLGSISKTVTVNGLDSNSKMTVCMAEVQDVTYMDSGQLIGMRLKMNSLKRNGVNISGKIHVYGLRVISDVSTNMGGFDSGDFSKGSEKER